MEMNGSEGRTPVCVWGGMARVLVGSGCRRCILLCGGGIFYSLHRDAAAAVLAWEAHGKSRQPARYRRRYLLSGCGPVDGRPALNSPSSFPNQP